MQNKDGKILLIGFGPGATDHMTLRARAAIEEADVVIGYTTYIRLVADLLHGKQVIRKGMTEEIDRCIEAWEQAQQGKTVALISSGDIGVYGMAGPTYEVLLRAGWSPDHPIQVEVVPGATALNAAASLIGAPLTHDFCAISLSDLLTPWPQIVRRLEAAGRGNFVIALYNPKSGRRTGQIVEAQRILLRFRDPATPVAVVKSAYRKRQSIQRVRLEQMATCDIGMLSTLLIGNSDSYWQQGLMITPRGYQNKYDALTGELHQGAQAGRSLSLGLEALPLAIRSLCKADPDPDPQAIADRLDTSLKSVLGALTSAEDAVAGGYRRIDPDALADQLRQCRSWPQVRIRLGRPGALSVSLTLPGEALRIATNRLHIAQGDFACELALARVDSGWLTGDEPGQQLQLVDHQGDALLQITRVDHSADLIQPAADIRADHSCTG